MKPASRLRAEALMPLTLKSDVAGWRRAAAHLGAIVVSAGLLWMSLGSWWALPLVFWLGYLQAFLFSALHETAHQTAFRTRFFNHAIGHVAGLSMLYPYEYYRAFHWDHHRYTQDPERDPELAMPLPATRAALMLYLTGLPSWVARIRLLVRHASGRVTARWVPADKRALIVREARAYLGVYALVALVSIAMQSWMAVWLWVVPVMLGQLFLRPYLMSEHVGCAHSGDMLENTRTTHTHALVRFFAWDMPYHVEHHAYPAVPFHALVRLNGLVGTHAKHVSPGYRASVGAAVRHIVGSMTAR